jgi:autophagy-related protein 5
MAWFDVNGEPLRWHLPVGVLFDLYANTEQLPWEVTIHFRHFPVNQLIRCVGDETVRSVFFNTLKEVSKRSKEMRTT